MRERGRLGGLCKGIKLLCKNDEPISSSLLLTLPKQIKNVFYML